MNAINRDKVRAICHEIACLDCHGFDRELADVAQMLLRQSAERNGADVRFVESTLGTLDRAISDEKERLAESAELSSELAAIAK